MSALKFATTPGSTPAHPHALRSLVLALLLAAAGTAAGAPPERSTEGPWARGRVLVMPQAGLTETDVDRVAAEVGGKASRLTPHGLHLIELPGNASERAVQARLAHHPHLKFAELDREVQAGSATNDPYFGSAWHLERIGAPTAWDRALGDGVTIAILDTGVDASHPDLAGRLLSGWNFVDNNSSTADVHGHGTGVAGAAAASTDNGLGVAAVAGRARLLPVRVADAKAYAYWSTIAQGITWAADRGARVINISYDQLPLSSAVVSAAQYARSKGSLVVVAAGNRARDEGFTPTGAMIAVSATDTGDLLTSWSSWGSFVSMSAPGLNVWSTNRGGGYGAWWGTSVASPVTAGVVALMMSANPSLSNAQIESLLFASADDLGVSGRDPKYGHGRVNAARAVQAAAAARVDEGDTQAPSVAIASPSASSTVAGVAAVAVTAGDDVGVTRVELSVNGSLVGADTVAPFGFSWDTTKVPNGMVTLNARACDAAGHCADSAPVTVNVANATAVADLLAPVVGFTSPGDGARVSGVVTVSAQASDDRGTAGLSLELSVDGARVSSNTGSGTLVYKWNTKKLRAGGHTLRIDARDAAGNHSSATIGVTR